MSWRDGVHLKALKSAEVLLTRLVRILLGQPWSIEPSVWVEANMEGSLHIRLGSNHHAVLALSGRGRIVPLKLKCRFLGSMLLTVCLNLSLSAPEGVCITNSCNSVLACP